MFGYLYFVVLFFLMGGGGGLLGIIFIRPTQKYTPHYNNRRSAGASPGWPGLQSVEALTSVGEECPVRNGKCLVIAPGITICTNNAGPLFVS